MSHPDQATFQRVKAEFLAAFLSHATHTTFEFELVGNDWRVSAACRPSLTFAALTPARALHGLALELRLARQLSAEESKYILDLVFIAERQYADSLRTITPIEPKRT